MLSTCHEDSLVIHTLYKRVREDVIRGFSLAARLYGLEARLVSSSMLVTFPGGSCARRDLVLTPSKIS